MRGAEKQSLEVRHDLLRGGAGVGHAGTLPHEIGGRFDHHLAL